MQDMEREKLEVMLDKAPLAHSDILQGTIVYLRLPNHSELKYIQWLWSDPETMKEVGGPICFSNEQAEKWFAKKISPGKGTDCYCLIFNTNDEPVGKSVFIDSMMKL